MSTTAICKYQFLDSIQVQILYDDNNKWENVIYLIQENKNCSFKCLITY